MKRGGVLSPLGERPGFLSGAFMVLLAVTYPLFLMPDPDVNAGQGGSTLVLLEALWRETIIFPGAVGLLVGGGVNGLRAASFGWLLPHLDRRIRFDTFIVAGVVAAFMTLFHAYFHTSIIAGFGVAVLAFATCFTMYGIASPRGIELLAVLVAILMVNGDLLMSVVQLAPAPVGVMAAATGVTFIVSVTSAEGRRRRIQKLGAPPSWWTKRLLDRLFPTKVVQGPRLKTGSVWEWVRLTRDQKDIGQIRVTFNQLLHAALEGTIAFVFMNGMYAIVMFSLSGSSTAVRGPAGPFVYPISRRKRAAICVAGNLITTLVYCAGMGGIIAILTRWAPFLHIDLFTSMDDFRPANIVPMIAALLIFLPFAQWTNTQPPVKSLLERAAFEGMKPLNIALWFVTIIGVVVGGLSLAELRKTHWAGLFYPLVITLIVISNFIYLRLLQRSFMTKDLV